MRLKMVEDVNINELLLTIDIYVMIKNLYCCSCTKTQYCLVLNYKGVGEEGYEGGLSNWNQGNY